MSDIRVPKADKYFLSFGGGVNSTAMLLWLMQEGIFDHRWEVVFCDPGAEMPETYEHVKWVSENITPVTVIETMRDGLNLEDYCVSRGIIPTRLVRWCTYEYKVLPLSKYCVGGVEAIGIDAGEEHRMVSLLNKMGADRRAWFPLVDQSIDRDGCVALIKEAGVPVPPKSGCFFCPFTKRSHWRYLYENHCDLFKRAQRIEQAAIDRRVSQGKEPIYLTTEPLATWTPRTELDPNKAIAYRKTNSKVWHIAQSALHIPATIAGWSIWPDPTTVTLLREFPNYLPDPLCQRCNRALDIDYALDSTPAIPCNCYDG